MRTVKKTFAAICFMIMIFTPFAAHAVTELPIPTSEDGVNTTTLELSTDQDNYQTGDIIKFTIKMEGVDPVDIYMTVNFPNGSFASYSTSLMPDNESLIIPLATNFPLADFSGEYTLPLPVIPIWPEGSSEIWMVFVKAGKNPMMSVNWLAEDMVTFSVDQADDVDPLLNLEDKTFTAPIGEMGTIEITFGKATVEDGTISGSVAGAIVLTGPMGIPYEREVTGTYSYMDETLTIHLEGEEDFFIDISLAINEDGTLTGTYETIDGKNGDIELALPAEKPDN
ncbi:MAG: hypothetical protein HQK61_02330 [Desulfamplus sp.]|nr:hypothetical protein [Desulfamplus sp.]